MEIFCSKYRKKWKRQTRALTNIIIPHSWASVRLLYLYIWGFSGSQASIVSLSAYRKIVARYHTYIPLYMLLIVTMKIIRKNKEKKKKSPWSGQQRVYGDVRWSYFARLKSRKVGSFPQAAANEPIGNGHLQNALFSRVDGNSLGSKKYKKSRRGNISSLAGICTAAICAATLTSVYLFTWLAIYVELLLMLSSKTHLPQGETSN